MFDAYYSASSEEVFSTHYRMQLHTCVKIFSFVGGVGVEEETCTLNQ